jgi:SM-20-related protein
MTPKQILDSFSETLISDEQILSAQERALVTSLVQHAEKMTAANQSTQEAVRRVIASAVGEIVAQRAFTVLGSSIVERIVQGNTPTATEAGEIRQSDLGSRVVKAAPKDPQPPHPAPTVPLSPTSPMTVPGVPTAPSPKDPQPPHGIATTVISKASAAVADKPESLPARCIVLDEFLAPQEVEDLMRFTLEHEMDFQTSEVIAPHEEDGIVNYDHRRSRVLMELEKHQDLILERIQSVLPDVLQKLEMDAFPVAGVEAQITASNDGDFFRFHSDNASDRVASRTLTFVYFFHREPRQFQGGELRIHDAHLDRGAYVSQGTYQTIAPQQNQIVLFPCELLHEITPVTCPSRLFADSRFTLNGWLRR